MEGFIFGDKVKSMALGISLTKINLADIIMKLFRKRLSNCWLTELNVCKFLFQRTLGGRYFFLNLYRRQRKKLIYYPVPEFFL